MNIRMGDRVSFKCNTEKAQVFDPKTELSLLWA
jgi:hypothetical protein